MIGDFGVLSTGFVPKRVTDITGQLQDAFQGDFGAAFTLLSQTPEGQLANRFSEQIADGWEAIEQAYNSAYPATASGTSLDYAESMTNVPRIRAAASVVNGVVLTGTPGTPIPNTLQLSVAGAPSSVFQIAEATTIGGGGTVSASFVATSTGPTQCAINTLTMIVTPISGLASVTNPAAAEVGQLAETDSAYRARAATQRNQVGTASMAGIIAAVQQVTNVTQAYGFSNDTDTTDANGNLPHSILLVVVGGVDEDVANAIYAAKGAGIQTNGGTTAEVVDSQGNQHAISFSRLTQLPIYVIVNVTPNTTPSTGPVYPANGDTLINQAIVAWAAALLPGQTVVQTQLYTPVNSVPGILDAAIYIGTAPSPGGTANIPVPISSIAEFLPANITVNS